MVQDREPEHAYNGVVVNWYDGSTDSLGAHADSEKSLISGASIYSFSLGAARTFRVHPGKGTGQSPRDFWLEGGDLVIMGGAMQEEFKHSIPASKKYQGRRINLTIRAFTTV